MVGIDRSSGGIIGWNVHEGRNQVLRESLLPEVVPRTTPRA